MRLLFFYLLVASLALSGYTHALATRAPPTASGSSASGSAIPDTDAPTQHTADALLGELLELIKSSRTISDFTPARLSATLGQSGGPIKGDNNRYQAFGRLTDEWSYGFGVNQDRLDGRWFEFRFDRNVAGASPAMTDICRPDFDLFTRQLEQLGFTRESNIVEDGRWMSDFFTRPGMRIEVFPRGEAADPHELVAHKCVEWVYIR